MKRLPDGPRQRFIAFEGGDGSGKTTLRKHLYRALEAAGVDALSLIPTSWLIPACTRVITFAKYKGVPTRREDITAAYVRDKEELCRRLIGPHVLFRHVICDRYFLSDVVYHNVLYGTDPRRTLDAYRSSHIVLPDLVLYVDTPPDLAARRMAARDPQHRNPWEAIEKQRRVYELFEEVLSRPEFALDCPVLRIDNSRATDEVLLSLDAIMLPMLTAS